MLSLQWLESFLAWLIVIFAVLARLRLLIGFVIPKPAWAATRSVTRAISATHPCTTDAAWNKDGQSQPVMQRGRKAFAH